MTFSANTGLLAVHFLSIFVFIASKVLSSQPSVLNAHFPFDRRLDEGSGSCLGAVFQDHLKTPGRLQDPNNEDELFESFVKIPAPPDLSILFVVSRFVAQTHVRVTSTQLALAQVVISG